MKTKKEKAPTETRALRVEIVKPLNNGGWETVGAQLRALRMVSHRVLQSVFLACVAQERVNRTLTKADATHPQTAGYRVVDGEIDDIKAWAKKALKKKAAGERVELLKAIAELNPSSRMKLGWSSAGYAAFGKWSKDKQKNAMPEWRRGAPIAINRDGVKMRDDGTGLVLSVQLDPAGTEWTDFAIKCGKGSHYGRVREMTSGVVRPGEVKLVLDERQKKWFAFVSYTRPSPSAPSECDVKKALVVHRGIHNALYLVCSDGRSYPIPGAKLLATKRRLVARRHEMQRIARCERGSGTHGHGKARRYAAPDSITDKEARVVRTWCQQMGAEVTKRVKAWGCGTIVIEDYGGIEQTGDARQRYLDKFPFYQLKQAIEWSVSKVGLATTEVPCEYISSVCPVCGNADLRQHNHRTGTFHCAKAACGFERAADYVAAFNMMKRAGFGDGLRKKLKREIDIVAVTREITAAE
ncbi:MAG: transposase [Gemmatimonadaceae bacterium]|nr:transposase [Gemmatimonadaceae bacterium]